MRYVGTSAARLHTSAHVIGTRRCRLGTREPGTRASGGRHGRTPVPHERGEREADDLGGVGR